MFQINIFCTAMVTYVTSSCIISLQGVFCDNNRLDVNYVLLIRQVLHGEILE